MNSKLLLHKNKFLACGNILDINNAQYILQYSHFLLFKCIAPDKTLYPYYGDFSILSSLVGTICTYQLSLLIHLQWNLPYPDLYYLGTSIVQTAQMDVCRSQWDGMVDWNGGMDRNNGMEWYLGNFNSWSPL